MNRKDLKIEICEGNIASVLEAERGGADRAEICDSLFEGGNMPSKSINLPVFVVAAATGNLFYHSSDYNIGTSEQILKIYNRLKHQNSK